MLYTDHYPFENQPLPYANNALEPYLDEETVHVHHDLQAQVYVNNLNYLLSDQPPLQQLSLDQLIRTAQLMRVSDGRPLLRNAGGVYNHRLYFESLQPPEEQTQPSGAFAAALEKSYGNLETMLTRFKAVALSVFGSGYAWLVANRNAELAMIITVNQETPLPLDLCPLLGIDVWEHAYYLTHHFDRSLYLDNLFHIINWETVSRRFITCEDWDLSAPNLALEVL